MTEHDLKTELFWLGEGAVHPRTAAAALERIEALEARAERAEALLREFMACRRIKDGREIGWIVSGPTEPTLLHVLAKVRAALEAKP